MSDDMPARVEKVFFNDHSFLGEYMSTVSDVTEAPTRYHMAMALNVLGILVGRRACLNYGHHKLYCITPTLLVGPSGIGKGEALGLGRAFLKKMKRNEQNESAIWVMEDEATPQAIAKALSLDPATRQPYGEDTNMDEVIPELAIIAGEMATFVNKSGERDNMIPVLTKLLEQDDSYVRDLVKDMDKRRRMDVKNPTVSLAAGTTIEWMRKLMPNAVFSGGFMRRCQLIVEEKKGRTLTWPRPLTDKQIDGAAMRMKAYVFGGKVGRDKTIETEISDTKPGQTFNFDKAKKYFSSVKQGHDKTLPSDPRLIGHHNSYPQHLMRTSILFAASEGRLRVTYDDIRAARAWLEILEPDIMQVLLQGETFGFEDKTQMLERIMLTNKRMSATDLRAHIRCPQREFDELITWATQVGMIKNVPRKNRRTSKGEPKKGELYQYRTKESEA